MRCAQKKSTLIVKQKVLTTHIVTIFIHSVQTVIISDFVDVSISSTLTHTYVPHKYKATIERLYSKKEIFSLSYHLHETFKLYYAETKTRFISKTNTSND